MDRDADVEVAEEYELMGRRGVGAARIVFWEEVPEAAVLGKVDGGTAVFNTIMVSERLTSASNPLGMARAALEIAVRYADRRQAFGGGMKQL